MFRKKQGKADPKQVRDSAAKMVINGAVREISYEEFLLSTNLSLEALMSVLFKKGIITPDELIQEIEEIRKRHRERSEFSSEAVDDESGDRSDRE